MTKTLVFSLCAVLFSAACGGGGSDPESDIEFIQAIPSEETLCSLSIGVSTRAEVEEALGEPTNFSEGQGGSILQYWYGTAQQFGMGNVRTIVIVFDPANIFESPSVDGLPFPQCWRDELAEGQNPA